MPSKVWCAKAMYVISEDPDEIIVKYNGYTFASFLSARTSGLHHVILNKDHISSIEYLDHDAYEQYLSS